ncbi:MAG: hypothetical protein JWM18_3371 [Chloroflexi bacterium]|nr:hypothetical protein [Chloroflexota bacterium]
MHLSGLPSPRSVFLDAGSYRTTSILRDCPGTNYYLVTGDPSSGHWKQTVWLGAGSRSFHADFTATTQDLFSVTSSIEEMAEGHNCTLDLTITPR